MTLSPTWIGVIINLCGNVVINISHNSVKYGSYDRQTPRYQQIRVCPFRRCDIYVTYLSRFFVFIFICCVQLCAPTTTANYRRRIFAEQRSSLNSSILSSSDQLDGMTNGPTPVSNTTSTASPLSIIRIAVLTYACLCVRVCHCAVVESRHLFVQLYVCSLV